LYQRQIADSKRGAGGDQERTIAELRAQVADLGSRLAVSEASLASAQAEAEALRASLAAAQSGAVQATVLPVLEAPSAPRPFFDKDSKASALEAKSRALDLLSYYIERITKAEPKDGSK